MASSAPPAPSRSVKPQRRTILPLAVRRIQILAFATCFPVGEPADHSSLWVHSSPASHHLVAFGDLVFNGDIEAQEAV